MTNLNDKKFIKLAEKASEKSGCFRQDRQIGAVIVKDNKVVGKGANEVPTPITNCKIRESCIRKDMNIESGTRLEICYANCAEMVALIDAADKGNNVEGAVLYCTHKPCSRCTRVLLAAKIKRFVYKNEYPDKFSDELVKEAGIECIKIK